MQEVGGSIPPGSTNLVSDKLTVFRGNANMADISAAYGNGCVRLRSLRRQLGLYFRAIRGPVSVRHEDTPKIKLDHKQRPVRLWAETGSTVRFSLFNLGPKASLPVF
jgi:hypothetical protein